MELNNRVLLVDDDPEVLTTYREVLAGTLRRRRASDDGSAPFTLAFASSGEDAIRMVRQELKQGRRFTCGVFDMRMPGLDGLETIREVRKIDNLILCAVCTAYSDRSIDEIDDLF